MSPNCPDLRVMSFNVLNAHAGHYAGRWRLRKVPVAMAIWAYGPDLLGAQELQRKQADFLREQLGEYEFLSPGRDKGVLAGQSVAIFYRAGRFRKIEQGHFWLSKTPDKPGSQNWGSLAPRMCNWVRLADLRHDDERQFVFFNAHFDPFSRWARLRSGEILRDRIAAIAGPDPAIIAGDFNANAHRKVYQVVLAGPGGQGLILLDAYRQAHPQRQRRRREGTWHGRGFRLGRRLDWILHTSDFDVIDAAIDRAKRNGRYPSDHFPVTATLRWRENG